MQHTVAMAIRTVGAQICRRLDVLIEAAGKPPVVDIEGTRAPRRPLAPSALAAERAAVPALEALSPEVTPPAPKKRGRPPKNNSNKKVAVVLDSSSSEAETSDVSLFICFLFIYFHIFPGFLLPSAQAFFAGSWNTQL
jgi:hypothetical protein